MDFAVLHFAHNLRYFEIFILHLYNQPCIWDIETLVHFIHASYSNIQYLWILSLSRFDNKYTYIWMNKGGQWAWLVLYRACVIGSDTTEAHLYSWHNITLTWLFCSPNKLMLQILCITIILHICTCTTLSALVCII